MKPTIVLVHGAFADASSWNGVIEPLAGSGHRVIAAANPLRGLASDAAAISDLIASIDGPVVLVGHSYGGAVITNVTDEAGKITSLVYVGAFAPDAGEDAIALSLRFPGSSLGQALRPVPRADGTTDLYIARELFHEQFCADVPAPQAALMAASQRPVTQEALGEPCGDEPLWRSRPSWFVFGERDRNIPAELERFMAERARAIQTVELAGASHALGVSRPEATADMVLAAAALPAAV
jgi:pimeloyl-ACP methyl ester carboxylesterase